MKLTHQMCMDVFEKMPIEKKRAAILLLQELQAAEEKHPKWPKDFIYAAAIVSEESGELIRSAVQYELEKGQYYSMMKEAAQTGAMSLRFIINMPEKRLKKPRK